MRCANNETHGRACVVNISNEGKVSDFNHNTGFIDFPGGTKKFSIRYDEKTGKYISLANYIPEEFYGFVPAKTRNTLALVSSDDLVSWEVYEILLQNPDVEHVGFQYVGWLFEGDDIISVIRTAFQDKYGMHANNQHDANHMVFYRIENFRKYLEEVD